MKQAFATCILLLLSLLPYSQEVGSMELKPDTDYLRKSKTQKTFAWILTGAGVGIIAIGALTQSYVDGFTGVANEKNSTSPIVYAVGGTCIVGGVLLFVAASKNRKKANGVSVSFNIEQLMLPKTNAMSYQAYPALGIKLSLH